MFFDENELAEFFQYLDNLRESGVTNMFGAGQYLESEFEMDKRDATDVLMKWMDTFDEDCSPEARAETALAVI